MYENLFAKLVSVLKYGFCVELVSKDHVQILVSASQNISPSDIMRRIKGRVSRKIYGKFSNVMKRYWGKHFWARDCFCVTFGELKKDILQEYIEHHFKKIPRSV